MFLSFSKQKYAIEHFNKANYVQKSNNIVKRKIEYLSGSHKKEDIPKNPLL